jgi:hypothetical protein
LHLPQVQGSVAVKVRRNRYRIGEDQVGGGPGIVIEGTIELTVQQGKVNPDIKFPFLFPTQVLIGLLTGAYPGINSPL